MQFCGRRLDIDAGLEQADAARLREEGRQRRFLSLDELLPLMCDPLDRQPLVRESGVLRSPDRAFAIVEGCPQLFPCDLSHLAQMLQARDTLNRFSAFTALQQYCAFGLLKGSTQSNNLAPDDAWYARHLWRSCRMLENVRGRFLDIGCDNAYLSRGMLQEDVAYVGLDPAPATAVGAMRVGGLGEFLPFRDATFDAAGFMTSLDHMLDYKLSLDEARRVIRPGGHLYLATLLWTGERAQLHTDTVHFHHFRPYEIEGALAAGFAVEEVRAYGWKGDAHRFGVYIRAARN